MKKINKRILSLVVALMMIISTMSLGAYGDDGNINANIGDKAEIMPQSLLDLKRISATIDLTGYLSFELRNMKVRDVLALMEDSNGNKIYPTTISAITTVWENISPDNLIINFDSWKKLALDDTFNAFYRDFRSFTIIVGSGKQLDPSNTAYDVTIEYTPDYNFTLSKNSSSNSSISIGSIIRYNTYHDYNFPYKYYELPVRYTDVASDDQLILNFNLFKTPSDFDCDYYIAKYNIDKKTYEYKEDEKIENNSIITKLNTSFYIMAVYKNKKTNVSYKELFNIKVVHNKYELSLYNLYDSNRNNPYISIRDYDKDYKTLDTIITLYLVNHKINETYSCVFTLSDNFNTSLSDAIVKACVGYKSLEEMNSLANNENIMNDLFDQKKGYSADFSAGVNFTFLFADNTIQHVKVITIEDTDIHNNIDVSQVLIQPNTYAEFVNIPSYYTDYSDNTYKSILLKDNSVDLSKLTLQILSSSYIKVYRDNKEVFIDKVDENQYYKFYSLPETSYTNDVVYEIEINGNTNRIPVTYNINKYSENSPQLYVYGPKNKYIESLSYKRRAYYDILIANIGGKELTGLNVSLNATGTKLDDYWTVGGENNNTLAALKYDHTLNYNGFNNSFAKIRLIPDGSGKEISGTLTITADGQDPVVINLTGPATTPDPGDGGGGTTPDPGDGGETTPDPGDGGGGGSTPSPNPGGSGGGTTPTPGTGGEGTTPTPETDDPTIKVETDENGNKITTETREDGVVVETTEDKDGNVEAKATVPEDETIVTVQVPADLGDTAGTVLVEITNEDGTTKKVIATYVDGKINVKLEENATVKVLDDVTAFVQAPAYTDTASHWATKSIENASKLGLFFGTSATTFSPESNMTREQMWMVLSRLQGEGQDSMGNAKKWAMEKGISDGSNPKGDVTREQFVTLLWRAMGEPKSTYDLSSYSDHTNISSWAKEAFTWAVEIGLVSGTTTSTLSPQGNATRAQIATIFERLIY